MRFTLAIFFLFLSAVFYFGAYSSYQTSYAGPARIYGGVGPADPVFNCIGRALPNGGQCHFNALQDINHALREGYNQGWMVWKKKKRKMVQKALKKVERKSGCIQEKDCIPLVRGGCPPCFTHSDVSDIGCVYIQGCPPEATPAFGINIPTERFEFIPEDDGAGGGEGKDQIRENLDKGVFLNTPTKQPFPEKKNFSLLSFLGIIGEAYAVPISSVDGAWNGPCAGQGLMNGKVFEKYPNDPWPSRTGCYNPEERYSFTGMEFGSRVATGGPADEAQRRNDGVFPPGFPDGWAAQYALSIGQEMKGVPRDDILTTHKDCVITNKSQVDGKRGMNSLKSLAHSPRVKNIQCLYDDYIDDFDDFCRAYSDPRVTSDPSSRHVAGRWFWHYDNKCWLKIDMPFITRVGGGDHWLPLAITLPSSESSPSTAIPIGGTEDSTRYGYLGEMGFRNTRIDFKWRFNRFNVYNRTWKKFFNEDMDEEEIDAVVLMRKHIGAKLKRHDCLKLYLEGWAHRGDCGEIIVKGARGDIDLGHCQWVAQYKMNKKGGDISVLSELAELIAGVTEGLVGEEGAAEAINNRGMRSEYYDYENFNRAGWVAGSGQSDICTLRVDDGRSKHFVKQGIGGGTLNFTRRGCPTVSGPNQWPDFFNMNSCDFEVGAKRINNILNILSIIGSSGGGGAVDGGGYFQGGGGLGVTAGGGQPTSEQAGQSMMSGMGIDLGALNGMLLTTKIKHPGSLLWGLTTGGAIGISIIVPPTGPLPLKEWADYSWVASNCKPLIDKDVWCETADYKPDEQCNDPFAGAGGPPPGAKKVPPRPDIKCEDSCGMEVECGELFFDCFDDDGLPVQCPCGFGAGMGGGEKDDLLSRTLKKLRAYEWPAPRIIPDVKAAEEEAIPGEFECDEDAEDCGGPGFPLFKGNRIFEWEMGASAYFNGNHWCSFDLPFIPVDKRAGQVSYGRNLNDLVAIPGIDAHMYLNSRPPNDRLKLDLQLVERIRDGCGPFSHRGTWIQDRDGSQFSKWIIGKSQARCENWKGLFAREYDNPRIVNWRLPRFNYEFVKAFIECTGPITKAAKPCDPVDWLCVAYNCIPKQYGGCGCCYKLDDCTQPEEGFYGVDDEPFGFWCKCKRDNFITTECQENYCTCEQIIIITHGILTVCQDYGPFRRWLNCFYQARAKSCPVLTRDISNGIVAGTLMHPPDDEQYLQFKTAGVCTGFEPDFKKGPLRWQAAEPNILAKLPLVSSGSISMGSLTFADTAERAAPSGGGSISPRGMKHFDFVFQSQVRDIEAPFMEPTIPFPVSKFTDILDESARERYSDLLSSHGVWKNCIENSDKGIMKCDEDADDDDDSVENPYGRGMAKDSFVTMDTDKESSRYNDALRIASAAWRDNKESTRFLPSPRAQEAIVGPRGCDIGGWYEMMLYQARCIRWFGLNCICNYEKTFIEGSAEAYVLKRGGMMFQTVLPFLTEPEAIYDGAGDPKLDSDGNELFKYRLKIVNNELVWPLMWRGDAGPDYAPDAVAGSKLWDKENKIQNGLESYGYIDESYRGLSEAKAGDFIIYDETLTTGYNNESDNPVSARYRRHIAYVESADHDRVLVTEWNYGKNMDSCGNTDRWKNRTKRTIYRSPDGVKRDHTCDNPDWKICFEPNWERIKVYRQSLDIPSEDNTEGHPRPQCLFPEMPVRLSYETIKNNLDRKGDNRVDSTGTEMPEPPSRELASFMDGEELINTGGWQYKALGMYNELDVVDFLKENLGTCDVVKSQRGTGHTTSKRIHGAIDAPFRSATGNCLEEISGLLKGSAGGPGGPCKKSPAAKKASGVTQNPPMPTTSGPGFEGICALLGNYSGACDDLLGCMSEDPTDSCSITGCFSDSDIAACEQVCAYDPSNTLCDILDCGLAIDSGDLQGAKACCGVVDIPECCGLLDLGGALLECANDPGLVCCDIYPSASSECRKMLGCATGLTSSSPTFEACCEYFPNEICQIEDCLRYPGVQCCTLFGDNSSLSSMCSGILDCIDSPTTSCCSLIPDTRACSALDCLSDLTGPSAGARALDCCPLIKEAVPQCDTLLRCLSGEPDDSCCSLFPDLLICEWKGCYENFTGINAGNINFGELVGGCCDALPSLPQCRQIASCLRQPSIDCCSAPGMDKVPQCAALFECVGGATVECCGLVPGIPECSQIFECIQAASGFGLGFDANEEGACTTLFCPIGCTEGVGIPSLRGQCVTGTTGLETTACAGGARITAPCDTIRDDFVNNCCALFPDISQCAMRDLAILDCALKPGVACCSIFPGANPKCRDLLACMQNLDESCCQIFTNEVAGCKLLSQCVSSPSSRCCSLFPESSTECRDILSCARNPEPVCCGLFTGSTSSAVPVCTLAQCLFSPNPSQECCKSFPNNPICKALYGSNIFEYNQDCYDADSFGGCDCPVGSPGGPEPIF